MAERCSVNAHECRFELKKLLIIITMLPRVSNDERTESPAVSVIALWIPRLLGIVSKTHREIVVLALRFGLDFRALGRCVGICQVRDRLEHGQRRDLRVSMLALYLSRK